MPLNVNYEKYFLHRYILLALWNTDGAGFDSVGDVCSLHLSDLFLAQERIQTLQGIYAWHYSSVIGIVATNIQTQTYRVFMFGKDVWCSSTNGLLSA